MRVRWFALLISIASLAGVAGAQAPVEPPAAAAPTAAAPTPTAQTAAVPAAPIAAAPAAPTAAAPTAAAPTAPTAAAPTAAAPAAPPAAAPTTAAPAAAVPTVPAAPPDGAAAPSDATATGRALEHERRMALVRAEAERLRIQREAKEPEVRRRATDREAQARYTLALSVDALWNSDAGYDLFAEDEVAAQLGLWVGADLVALGPQAVLAGELGFATESAEATALWSGQVDTTLRNDTLLAGVSLKLELTSWLVPQVRVSGGVSLLKLELSTSRDGAFEDEAVSPFAALGAGFLLQTPSRLFENKEGHFASLAIGLLVEGGYALRAPVELALEKRGGATQPIAVRDASLGELALSGPYVRTSAVVRF
jgi:hypothetical protein